MKGTFKRALAGVAAAALAATGLALTAGSANAVEGDSSTITITGDVAGRTFTAYPLGAYQNVVAGTDGCASSVDFVQNAEWQNPTIAKAVQSAMTTIPTEYVGNELAYMTRGTGDQLRAFAVALAAAATKPADSVQVTAPAQAESVSLDVADDGWYLVIDSDGSPLLASTKITLPGGTVADCLVDDTVGEVVAKPNSLPIPDKKVQSADGTWVESVDALVGSTVKFQVTTEVPNYTGYSTYDWQVVDTPSKGLVIDQNTMELSVNVDGVSSPFTAYRATVADNVLTVAFDDVTKLPIGATIVITYQATLTADAIETDQLGGETTNRVVVKHDGTPSGEGITTVKTYGFRFTKTDAEGTSSLPDAKFTVQKDNEHGQYLTPSDAVTEGGWTFSDTEHEFEGVNGVFEFKGLPAGTYYVAETQVPDGYIQNVQAKFTVTIENDGTVKIGGDVLDLVTDPTDNVFTVKNVKSVTQLPLTGAAGTALFTVLGLLIAGVGVLAYVKSRSVRSALRRG
ncbi:SpaA isopeptide-forming pilin-related protein [uncultured Bifidobacterium sp.]|uniref:SpaA isopeptide-forming pilin-related protein n=1 Tax=uncultured Bifidobacterium sp. TaxID=165187 RepID=UPI002593DAA1|nr:isopeptide-forming domain-containing fimbrial protein [uncultured Bifidobacterium sp.]